LALVVAVGGVIELIRGGWHRRRAGSRQPSALALAAEHDSNQSTPGSYTNFSVLTIAVFVYLVGLSWLGFQISTLLFTSGILMWLGARWWSAILSSLAIVVVVRVLFVGLFHVQLPSGVFGWSF